MTVDAQSSSTGLDAELAATLAYVFGWVSGVTLLVIERRNEYVRFHALQSTITFLLLMVAGWIAAILPLIGGLLEFVLAVGTFVAWVFLMVKAWQGERFELPLIGEFASERAEIDGPEVT